MASKKRFTLEKHLPLALSIVGSVGVIGTAISSILATSKAIAQIETKLKNRDEENEYDLTKSQIVCSTWVLYIPTMIIGATTISAIFLSGFITKKQILALSSAYTILNSSYNQYCSGLKQECGEKIHERIINRMVLERSNDETITAYGVMSSSSLNFNPNNDPEVKRTFYDSFSNRYFESTIDKVLQAEYHLNRNFVLRGYVTLNEFYEFIGISGIENGDLFLWEINDEMTWIDFDHHSLVMDDGLEVCVLDMVYKPGVDRDI